MSPMQHKCDVQFVSRFTENSKSAEDLERVYEKARSGRQVTFSAISHGRGALPASRDLFQGPTHFVALMKSALLAGRL